MGVCALCGKEMKGVKHIKGVTYFELFGKELCFDCYGYASLICKSSGDLESYTINDLKAICERDSCDLCGKKIGKTDRMSVLYLKDGVVCKNCQERLRPFFAIDREEKVATGILNAASAVVNTLADTAGTMNTYSVDDPMEKATVRELKNLLH